MKKKIILRGIWGFPVGMAIGYAITILISLGWGEGYYYSCTPELVEAMGSEINAVLVQALLTGLIGLGSAAGSVVWETEWGLVKQTGIYFCIESVLLMPTAYVLYWMEHSVGGFLSYFGIFMMIYVAIWMTEFAVNKALVKRMNENLHKAE